MKIVPVSALLDKNFFIRAYQRGYRWGKTEVEALLRDIDEFKPTGNPETWYCLQPLVVKKMASKEKTALNLPDPEQEWFEVIDGQQRLTTIFLLIHYANEMWRGKQKDSEPRIRYETRPNSAGFLKTLQVDDDWRVSSDKSNIDYHHMAKAYETIHSWVADYSNRLGGDSKFYEDSFQAKLKAHTRVIWYEVAHDENSEDIFTRLNMGKIPLTNAELVKALLLSEDSISIENHAELQSKFPAACKEELRLKQLEIAAEWDRIEYALNDDEFWGFIADPITMGGYQTKMDYLLELVVPDRDPNNRYAVFNHFYELWNKDKTSIKKLWDDNVAANFNRLEEWSADRWLYHTIGYLLSFGGAKVLMGLLEKARTETKHGFRTHVDQQIRETMRGVVLDDLSYANNSDKEKLLRVLTLFNVLSVLRLEDAKHRYPFGLHKEKKWSLEHIHAQQSEGLKTEEGWREWLTKHRDILSSLSNPGWSEMTAEITAALDESKIRQSVFEQLSNRALVVMSQGSQEPEKMHGISNMALLAGSDNSELNNSAFAVKRKRIIDLDKAGSYIPLCTRNVFLKYYNDQAASLYFWDDTDHDKYRTEIDNVLTSYLE